MKRLYFIAILFLTVHFSSNAHANEQLRFGDWNIFKIEKNGKNHCIAYSKPYRTMSNITNREEPFMLISNKGKNKNSIGIRAGYKVVGEKGFTMKINRRSHLMDVKLAENVWTFSDDQDVSMLNEMLIDGRNIEVRGYDDFGKVGVDYYSLRGLNYAISYINSHCN